MSASTPIAPATTDGRADRSGQGGQGGETGGHDAREGAGELLRVRDLGVSFRTRDGEVEAVRGIDFEVAPGETLGIVGESGSGKSVSVQAVMRILDAGGRIACGEILYSGIDLRRAAGRELRELRGRELAMVFQDPRAALNPIRTVGRQIGDVLRLHARATGATAREGARRALDAVSIRDSERVLDAYPFELSGGMCQRVVIAMALACEPRLLIADEPTTGLDVTTQRSVMDLIAGLIRERGMGAILITHDLALAASYCDRIVVMRDGRIVERGAPGTLFGEPREAYTRRLVAATLRRGVSLEALLPEGASVVRRPSDATRDPASLAPPVPASGGTPLLSARSLSLAFDTPAGRVHAVRDVSFEIGHGRSLGLVGESGSGKSSTASIVARLQDADAGTLMFEGEDVGAVPARRFARHALRPRIQMVFQDSGDSLNPRHRARHSIAEPLERSTGLGRRERRERVHALAESVGLPHALLGRFPHQLSGGQRARVNIARALALDPALLVLDEPTAALDVSIQAVVLNLIADLRAERRLACLFVTHDLEVVRLMCDDVMVMRAGELVEQGTVRQVLEAPSHPYTRCLMEARPAPPPLTRPGAR